MNKHNKEELKALQQQYTQYIAEYLFTSKLISITEDAIKVWSSSNDKMKTTKIENLQKTIETNEKSLTQLKQTILSIESILKSKRIIHYSFFKEI